VETAEVVVAGAGIIGLSLALDLAARGLSVIVLERGRAMRESSWAAAGMLAAHDPENPPALQQLADLSLDLYPAYLAQIERLSSRKVPLPTKIALQAIPPGHAPESGHTISFAAASALIPDLQPVWEDFLVLDETSLDPRDLCAALPLAAVAAGARLIEDTPVISVEAKTSQVVIQTPKASFAATHFVNCSGAWAPTATTAHVPVAPAKGQILTVRLRQGDTLSAVLRTPEIYLVPRGDGRVTVVATVEDAGFDKTVEADAIARLLSSAAALWPPIARGEIVESWAGLRPATRDELPLIGPTVGSPNCWIASGHYRNGILLAPATARVVTQLLLNQIPSVDLSAFAPNRSFQPLDAASSVF
jgi:glycine oxidase